MITELNALREILEHPLTGYWDWDIPSGNEYLSPSLKKMFGYEDEELPNRAESWQRLIFEEDIQKAEETFKQHIQSKGKIPYYSEMRYHHKNGSIVWAICTGKMIEWDESGYPKRMVGAHFDITRRKLAEQAIFDKEAHFQKILNQAPIGMGLVNMDGVIEYLNQKAIKFSGYNLEDIPTMKQWLLKAFPDKEYRKLVIEDWERRVRKAMVEQTEIAGKQYRVTCKDNSIKTVFINGMPIGDKIFVMSDDITERKQIEDALHKSERRFRNIIETSQEWIWAIDKYGNHTYSNPAIRTVLGYEPSEILGKDAMIFLHDDDKQIQQQKFPEYLARKKGWSGLILRWRHKNGSYRFLESNSTPVFDDDGEISGFWGADRDITERLQAEEAIRKAQKLDSLGVLAGGIAHDFNNLLGGIFGFVDLARSVSTEPETLKLLNETMSVMNRARALTLQLLTFAKGGAPIQKITALVSFIQETVQFALSGSNVSCVFTIDKNLAPCSIDRNQVAQVIDNIVINAVQAMPNGGKIEVSAGNIHLHGKQHSIISEGDYVQIAIKDSGIGIPDDILPRIFDPFYTTKPKGHGLGLATSYSIIKRHGGMIDVESEPGRGSIFSIYLPAALEAAETNTAVVDIHKGCGTVIVIDDEEVLQSMYRRMLESMGYKAVCMRDGRTAIDFYSREVTGGQNFTAMIFDLTIPGGMGGIEAITEVRKIDPSIPVFVVSGYANNPVIKNPEYYGFNASMCKPFKISDLSDMLSSHLPRR